ncbi:MAG TPA: beta-L-arabinofuranosidase domain-containing protein, partial [Kineosporiaceae bacterium]|nr:beta-L-arabinofuranosidase domain-containing protein [Kineosporiaceae bacterium]
VCRLRPVPLGAVTVTGGLWEARREVNGDVAVPLGRERLEAAGNLDNLRIAAGTISGDPRGPVFMDSDVYKWLEAAAWEYARRPSEELLQAQREITAIVADAQQPDGYLDSIVQLEQDGERYRELGWSHEHYCAGHLFQAAVAQVRCTGERGLLDVAVRLADHLVRTFGENGRHDLDGHPEVEMALVELYRETGTRGYLDLARYFVEARGQGRIVAYGREPAYFADRVPVREQTTVEGHAVRAVYLGAGAADVALELGDAELLTALERQFAAMEATKTYVTGGLGSRWDGEAFGDPYELPPDRAYAESCAAIGGVYWAWRMLLATGDPRYADAAERTLFNGFLAGVSLSGDRFFYVNPLHLREGALADESRSPAHGRRPWFDVACCPPNIMRTLASLPGYLATTDDEGLQLHQYVPSDLTTPVAGGEVRISVETEYPWDGLVRIRIADAPEAPWCLALRVPAWAEGATVRVRGEEQPAAAGTYVRLTRSWRPGDVVELSLPMTVRFVEADERVDAVRGCVAIERGPLVFAVEHVDQADGVVVDDLRLDPAGPASADHRPDLLDGVTVVTARGRALPHAPHGRPYPPARTEASPDGRVDEGTDVEVTAVPYFSWANRGIGPMRVWLPRI